MCSVRYSLLLATSLSLLSIPEEDKRPNVVQHTTFCSALRYIISQEFRARSSSSSLDSWHIDYCVNISKTKKPKTLHSELARLFLPNSTDFFFFLFDLQSNGESSHVKFYGESPNIISFNIFGDMLFNCFLSFSLIYFNFVNYMWCDKYRLRWFNAQLVNELSEKSKAQGR